MSNVGHRDLYLPVWLGREFRQILAALWLSCGMLTAPVYATNFSWTSGSIFDLQRWDDSANWSNTGIDFIGFPDDTSDQATISGAQAASRTAKLTVNRTIGDLALGNGGDLNMNGKTLVINMSANQSGCACISGIGSYLTVGNSTLDADNIVVSAGGRIDIRGGTVQADFAAIFHPGGELLGYGRFQLPSSFQGVMNYAGDLAADGGSLVLQRLGNPGHFNFIGHTLEVRDDSALVVDMPATLTGDRIWLFDNANMWLREATTWHDVRVNEGVGPIFEPMMGNIRQIGDATVTGTTYIRVSQFNWEGENRYPSSTTIDTGATLTLDVEAITHTSFSPGYPDDGFRGDLTIADNGRLNVTNTSGNWFAQGAHVRLLGMAVESPQVVIGGRASFINGGTDIFSQDSVLEGNGRFLVDVTNSLSGIVRPGLSAGHLVFEEDFAQDADGTMEIELGGTTAVSQHDLVSVLGDAALDGTLVVSLIGGFTLDVGQRFEIIDISGAAGGEFFDLPDRGLVGNFGEDLFITYAGGDGNDVVLYTTPIPTAGDTNNDGMINVDDLNNVRNHFGTTGPDDGTLDGDAFPFDGRVNIDDLNAVRNNFGSSAVPVPEPSALLLTVAAIAICWTNSRHRPFRLYRFSNPAAQRVRMDDCHQLAKHLAELRAKLDELVPLLRRHHHPSG